MIASAGKTEALQAGQRGAVGGAVHGILADVVTAVIAVFVVAVAAEGAVVAAVGAGSQLFILTRIQRGRGRNLPVFRPFTAQQEVE